MREGAELTAGGYRYRSVMERVLGMIAEGALLPGERIPSLRETSAGLGVSLTTVMRAYAELERQGHIETRPQSGHYVTRRARPAAARPRPLAALAPAAKVLRSELIREVLDATHDPGVVPLGGAVPAGELLPWRDLGRLTREVLRDEGASALAYAAVQGAPEFRRQLSLHLLDAGIEAAPDDLLVTVGATEALTLILLALTRPGDTVIVESPTYFGFLLKFEALGLKVLEVPTDPERGIDLDSFARALRKEKVRAAVLQPNFGNPLGGLYPPEARRELLRLAREAGVVVVEDDLYGDLTHGERRPASLLAEDEGDGVIHIGAFSKILAPGFRVGWMTMGGHRDDLLRLKAASTLATSTLEQEVLARFLAEGRLRRHVRTLRAKMRTQVAAYAAHVARAFPEGTRITDPKGGFVLWIELPEGSDAMTLYRRAYREGIGLSPGPMYTAGEGFGNFLRINCGHPWSERVRDALDRVGEMAGDAASPRSGRGGDDRERK